MKFRGGKVNIDNLPEELKTLIKQLQKNTSWQDDVKLKLELHTKLKKDAGGGLLKDTANLLNESIGSLSQDINLAKALEKFPELNSEKTKTDARLKYKKLHKSEIDNLPEICL